MMHNDSAAPIGVYDSGVGGLTVLKALMEALPHENFVYFGDTANLPYGNKTKEQIVGFSRDIISLFQNEIGAKLVVAACHTSSALALDDIAGEFNIPIIGTIRPLLKGLLNNPQHKNIGIIATPASANSRVHEKTFRDQGFTGQIHTIGCPDFVPFIESGDINNGALEESARKYLSEFDDTLDTLIYGCTHYPFIKHIIEEILPPHIHYVDPAEYIASAAHEWLLNHNLLNTNNEKGTVQFSCSQDLDGFTSKIHTLLDEKHLSAPYK